METMPERAPAGGGALQRCAPRGVALTIAVTAGLSLLSAYAEPVGRLAQRRSFGVASLAVFGLGFVGLLGLLFTSARGLWVRWIVYALLFAGKCGLLMAVSRRTRRKSTVGLALSTAVLILAVMSLLGSRASFDASGWRGPLTACLVLGVTASLVNGLVFKAPAAETAISLLLVVVFSMYVIHHTQQLSRGASVDCADATFKLWLDFANLAIRLLHLLVYALAPHYAAKLG